jgi:DNA-binding LacI/PurR family transcriptional regulator
MSDMKRQSNVTSHEVAALAGVSRSSVSRAFTAGASVSDKTRKKVLTAAAELGYQPNALARSLTGSSSQMIGMVMGEWENPFYARMLRQFSERFQADGYQLLLLTSNSDNGVDDAIRHLLRYQVDGLITVSAKPSEAVIEECVKANTPLVLVNNNSAIGSVSSVNCDNAQVGRDIAELLLASGYRKFATVCGDPNLAASVERTDAMQAIVNTTAGSEMVAQLTGSFGYAAGRQAIKKLWQLPTPPDAVVCASDPTALGVLDGARLDLKIDVPDELAIVGLGDTPQADWGAYRLTTVHLPLDEIIEMAVENLFARLNDLQLEPSATTIEASLVQRETVRN